jgi:long-chain acyl-CoA synthetase
MAESGFTKETVRSVDSKVAHDIEAFPDLTETVYEGNTVRAYSNRASSLDALFRDASESYPDREFVVFPESSDRYTYAQFDERVSEIAAGLQDEGFERGERVGLLLPNSVSFLEIFLACARLGIVAVPINTQFSAGKLAQVLTDADPNAIITTSEHLSKVRTSEAAPPDERIFVLGGSEECRPYGDLRSEGPVDIDTPTENDTVCVFYTSGTTGQPKGCPVDNFHLTNAAQNFCISFGFNDGTTTLVPTPLYHVSGLVSGVIAVLSVAGKAVVIDTFSPQRFLSETEQENISYIMGVPTNYILTIEREATSEYDLSSLEICAYGSAPMPTEIVTEMRRAFPDAELCNTYGKTESAGGLASMCPDVHTDTHPDTVGLPTPCMEFRVVDDNENVLPKGEVGELVMRGPIVVTKYLNRPEKTAAEFEDGWHYTGDLAVINDEGFIELRGRDSDMLIRGGENVYPLEIRETLASLDSVLDSSVTGFPDEVLGERILAAVVPKPETRLTEENLREHCQAELADYKQPDIFRIVNSLPRNASGKIEKNKLLPEPLQHGIQAGE